jgi:hypothetical protein
VHNFWALVPEIAVVFAIISYFCGNVKNNFWPLTTIGSSQLDKIYVLFTWEFWYEQMLMIVIGCKITFETPKPILFSQVFTVICNLHLRMNEISSFLLSSCSFRHSCFPSWVSNSSLPSCSQSIHFGIFFPFSLSPGEIFHLLLTNTTDILWKVVYVRMQEVQLDAHAAAQVFKVLQQITHNILVIWPPCVSQEVFHNVFEALPCLFFKMIHGIFKNWISHEFLNLRTSKNTCFPAYCGSQCNTFDRCISNSLHPCPEPMQTVSWYPVLYAKEDVTP